MGVYRVQDGIYIYTVEGRFRVEFKKTRWLTSPPACSWASIPQAS